MTNIVDKKPIWNYPMSYAELCTYGTPVDYLESTGGQWIDTGINIGEGLKFRVKYSENYEMYGCMFGGELSMQSPRIFATNHNTGYGHSMMFASLKSAGELELTADYTIRNGKKTINNKYTPLTSSLPRIGLFGMYTNNSSIRINTPMRIHYFECVGKVYFHPMLDLTGRPCMFDMINKKYFYNKGNGADFLPGGAVTQSKFSPTYFMHKKAAMVRAKK